MTAVAIFVKTPGLSPIKTRLAKTIGAEAAKAWHLYSAHATAEVADLAGIGSVYWAVAEPFGDEKTPWSGFKTITQPSGSLGRRMALIQNSLIEEHGRCILLGADTPQIEPHELIDAHHWLNAKPHRQVMGPATDGGFWLYGANNPSDPALWDQVTYSQSETRQCFEQAMSDQGQWAHLSHKTDVDTFSDLLVATQALGQLKQASDKQKALLAWLRQQGWDERSS